MTSNKARGFAVEDTAGLLLKFAGGAIGTVTLSDTTPAPWSWELSSGENAAYPKQDQPCYLFAGTKGSLSVPTMELWSYPGQGGWYAPLSRAAVDVPSADPLVEQLRHFRAVIARSEIPLISVEDAMGTLAVVEAVREAALTGARVFPGPDHGAGRMNKRSIATVSLSGALDEKLRAIAAAGFDAVEIFENDLLSFSGSPRDVGQMCRDLGLSICAFQPFRDFEGMPEPQRARNFARAERKFDLMQELQTDLMLICSNISPASLGGIDRAAADFRELGERAAARGLRVGYEALAWGRARQRLPRRLGDRAARRPQIDRHHSRQLSCAGAVVSDDADSIDPGRQDLSGATGRRAETRPRRAVLEPAFPLLPGPGRPGGRAVRGSRARHRLCGPAVAGNIQRPVSRRLRGPHRDRRAALPHPARGRRPRRGVGRACHAAAAEGDAAAASASSNSPSAKRRPATSPRCSASSVFARPARTAARTSNAGRRATSIS